MGMVYECRIHGWMTEKECKDCYLRNKKDQYGHVKHCRRDNVSEVENNDGGEE
jgi:hypothetical protein